jgi:hypothetical protein
VTPPGVARVALGPRLEVSRVFTTLGIRFWDRTLEVPVTDGLRVSAIQVSGRYPPVPARRSASGVYVFHDLPLLRAVQYPRGPVDPAALVPAHDFAITVEDTLGRFLSCLFVVRLPLNYAGLFLAEPAGSPPGVAGRAYLFSAPTRAVPPGMAAVRADIWDGADDVPAAFAALRVDIGGRTHVGIADVSGHALVLFPYPTLEQLRFGSPPGTGQPPVTSMRWPVTIRVAYPPTDPWSPAASPRPLAGAADVPRAWREMPSLKPILRGTDAPVWATEAGPPVVGYARELCYGQELLVSTQGSAALASRLWIRGTSPP